MIEAKGVCKAYGPILALEDVSFQVNAGEVVGLPELAKEAPEAQVT